MHEGVEEVEGAVTGVYAQLFREEPRRQVGGLP